MKSKQLLKSREMEIVNILTSRNMRWIRDDIVRHKKKPEDYQKALKRYEIKVREEISETIHRGIRSSIFIAIAVSFLLYSLFILKLGELLCFLLLVSIVFVIVFVIPIFIAAIVNTTDLLICVVSKKYHDVGIYDYHTWIKVGEEIDVDDWPPLDFEVFNCSVCGKRVGSPKDPQFRPSDHFFFRKS